MACLKKKVAQKEKLQLFALNSDDCVTWLQFRGKNKKRKLQMKTQSGIEMVKMTEPGQNQKDKGQRERKGRQKLGGEAGEKVYSQHKSKHFYVHNPSRSGRVRANTGPALNS